MERETKNVGRTLLESCGKIEQEKQDSHLGEGIKLISYRPEQEALRK